ncbi:chalcone isomerase family protein [Hydrogenophaga sp. IBVHS2]|uniref:chalcone isomerase family protein n=1 Tax=Hydrogenophaga sp. IBVHS2 TaxID=1985170 RepID=UPI000A328575|nr:chalcone isomerase family protein [Hydrogenophaga sp. IBVHS2]
MNIRNPSLPTSLLAPLVCAMFLLSGLPAQANPPEPTLTAALQDKTSVGQARLKVWGFDVYDATLFARPGFDAARFGEQRFALELAYLRNFDGADIAERSIDEMRRVAPLDESRAAAWLKAMTDLFPNVKKGDRITGVHVPGVGARFYLNGRLLGEVADDAFSRQFFGIWLSPRTSQPRMRETLLQSVAGASPRTP